VTLAQLRHFIALAESGSYAKASKRLFLTQPALTRSIQALEEGLGQALFDRIGRRIALTTFGESVLVKAQRLVHEADALRRSGQAMLLGEAGSIRVGLGSGPGALLTVPLMLKMAHEHPRLQLQVSRGSTELLVHALRAQRLDAIIVDIRAMRPAADLHVAQQVEMAASFMCRSGHPLAQGGRPVPFAALLDYPIASTPLSDEVARILTERYGPQANPDDLVSLRGDDTAGLVEVARQSDTIVLTINAAGRDLHHLAVQPPLNATARFGLVTLADRTQAPALGLVAEMMRQVLKD
jgi:DNA-binding transcriptional LysR family regulator